MHDLTGQVIRSYEIGEKIGEGGNGAIYKAYQSEVGRDVVIKVILPHHANKSDFIQRFEAEAKLIAQLEHPYIVPLYEYWRDENGAFLVMRWIRGGSLRDALTINPQWLLSKTAHLLNQITDALAVAHEAGVIHRDIKPENILLDERGNAYLTDFGIAKNLAGDSQLTAEDAIVGSAAYFAPEQIQSQPVSPASDIYSLGMMVYEMLAGEHAYGSLSPVSLVMKHLQEPLPLLTNKRPDIPTDIHDILEKATAKDPKDRYLSAPEFAEAFQQAIRQDKPITLTTPSESIISMSTSRQSPDERNRSRMLEKVQDFWIKGVLQHSLHSDALLQLGMAIQSDAIERPWDMIVQQNDQQDQTLPEGIRITDVFYEMRGELLILGDPGSGKTTTLLELARDLILLAQMDSSEPMPVIFNLSSWADNRKPLQEWMVDELHTKYQIPVKIARDWLDHNQILPLLDGLDEVQQAHRNACVEAINLFRDENGLLPMVVCSRIVDYQALSQRLKLQGAITLQPLTRQQIETYFSDAGDELTTVHAILEEDEKLFRLVTSPLMLNIVTLAYRGLDLDEIPSFDTLAGRRKHIFDTYTDRMLSRRGADDRYQPDKTKHYLTWLATQMSDRAQSVYHIENMQPNWLGSLWKRVQYSVGVRFLGIMMSMLFFMSFYSIIIIPYALFNSPITTTLPSSILAVFLLGVSVGGAVGAVVSILVFFFRSKIQPVEALRWSSRRAVIGALVLGLSFALISATFFNMFATLSYAFNTTVYSAPIEEIPKEGADSFFVKEKAILTRFDGTTIELPLNENGFYTDEAREIIRREDAVYTDYFLVVYSTTVIDHLGIFLAIGLLTGAISGAVIGGLSGRAIDLRTYPNQGVRQSGKNFVRIGLAYSVLTVVSFFGSIFIFVPSYVLESIITDRALGWPGMLLIAGLLVPTVGLIIALSRGGYVVVQHTTLRTLLWREKNVPRNMARFLDYTSERVLTRKVGGGYIFIHRMLLEHFAQSEKQKNQAITEDEPYVALAHRLEEKPISNRMSDDDIIHHEQQHNQ